MDNTHIKNEIYTVFATNPDRSFGPSQLRDLISDSGGGSPSTVRGRMSRLCTELVQDGKLFKVGDGTYALVGGSVEPLLTKAEEYEYEPATEEEPKTSAGVPPSLSAIDELLAEERAKRSNKSSPRRLSREEVVEAARKMPARSSYLDSTPHTIVHTQPSSDTVIDRLTAAIMSGLRQGIAILFSGQRRTGGMSKTPVEGLCDVVDLRTERADEETNKSCRVLGCGRQAVVGIRVGNNFVYWGSRICYHHNQKVLQELQELLARLGNEHAEHGS